MSEYTRQFGFGTAKDQIFQRFDLHDSGKRVKFSSGMQRDTADNKPRYDLIFPQNISENMLDRWAELMRKGAEKYDERNWEKAETPEEYARFRESALRHMHQFIKGEADEDHAAAIMFNIAGAEFVKQKIKDKIDNGWIPEHPGSFLMECKKYGLVLSNLNVSQVCSVPTFADAYNACKGIKLNQFDKPVGEFNPVPNKEGHRLIYLASPYSHEREQVRNKRFRKVSRMADIISCSGILVFSPIAHSHPLEQHGIATELRNFSHYRNMDFRMIKLCDEFWVYMLEGYKLSRGIAEEIRYAKSIGMRIKYVRDSGTDSFAVVRI